MTGTARVNIVTVTRDAGLDIDKVLNWLAWRDSRLAFYDPKAEALPQSSLGHGFTCEALVVCGSAMATVPTSAADLFVDMLHPHGCRVVVLSGGVGRGTLALWRELVERQLTGIFGDVWEVGSQPQNVWLPMQGLRKSVLAESDTVPETLDERRRYCCEADVMLELFVERCRTRGLRVSFGGDPNACMGEVRTPSNDDVFVYLESASTNSGQNCALSAQALSKLGVDMSVANVALVQHPQAHRRACLTWEKQFGRPPMGWCPMPNEQSLGVSNAEMLLYALGEFRRIQTYSDPSKGFLVMPPDFPSEFLQPLNDLEPLLRTAIQQGLLAGAPTSYAASLGVSVDGSS